MDRLLHDTRFAWRSLRRTPGVFATAVLILGLGIGTSVAMFTIFRTVLVRDLPVVGQNRVVVMWTYGADPSSDLVSGTKDLSIVRQNSRTMQDVAAVAHWPAYPTPFRDGERSVALNRGMVTGNFFAVLGVRAALGRLLTSSDDEPPDSSSMKSSATTALVLSYRAWREKFAADSAVLGQRLVDPSSETAYRIVGVAPAGFDYPAGVDYWIPMWQGWQSTVSAFAVARLRPDATVAEASSEYLAIERRLEPTLALRGAHAATFADTVLGDARPALVLLTIGVAILLLIACLNVGNLLLLKASSRRREIAVRRALGATYGDVLRQFIVEAGIIAVIGGVVGLYLAIGLIHALPTVAPPNLPRLDEIRLSRAPVLIAMVVSSITVIVFGVVPALLSARSGSAIPLRHDARTGSETRRRRIARQALVSSQIALAMVLLGGAALLARSLERLETQDTGFVSNHLSVFGYAFDLRNYRTWPDVLPVGDAVVHRIQSIPGIVAATQIVVPPMLGNGIWLVRFSVEGQSDADSTGFTTVPAEMCGPEFFRTFGVHIDRGRAFTDDDRATSTLVAIVSESAARRLWPGQDPLGKRIHVPGAKPDNLVGGDGWRTVVGVAHDTHLRTLREASPMIYLPSLQGFWQGYVAIRSTVPLGRLLPALRAAGHDVDPRLELENPQTMDQILAQPLAQPRLSALLMSGFGIVALLLAAIGLFGVMASIVRDQRREFGIRIALGATPSRVRRDVLARASSIAGAGVVVGFLAALGTSRLLSSLLFQVSPADPVALGAACVALVGVAALAAYLPARRATAIDPVEALRAD